LAQNGQFGDHEHGTVAGDHVDGHIGPRPKDHVQRADERMTERVQILVAQAGHVDETGAHELGADLADVALAAVDDDLVSALAEQLREMLDRRLEPTVMGGDAARADEGDLHVALSGPSTSS
jgi:hypothetical protein